MHKRNVVPLVFIKNIIFIIIKDLSVESVVTSFKMRIFGIVPELRNYRLMKIGFWDDQLYVSPSCADRIQVWSIHSFIPNSWSKLFDFRLIQLFYSFYTMSPNEPYIYALVVALFDCDVPRISILRIYMDSGASDMFNLDEASGDEFENKVFLENIVLGCGRHQLYMYERSVVMGPIPFWKITLLEDSMTFVITNETISADENEKKCSRFPIVLDGDKRRVFKLQDNHDIVVYDGESNCWNTYPPSLDTPTDLNLLRVRGISETYGQTVHRMGAVESPLTFYVNENICIAKIFRHTYHAFYHIIFDDERKVYRVMPAGKYRLPMHIQLRFYGVCSETQFAFICSTGIAFIPLEPSTLRQLSFLALQRQHCKIIGGIWCGGISEQMIKASLELDFQFLKLLALQCDDTEFTDKAENE
ncbi:Cadherin-related tumor suppressor [Dirofilaria immitis]